jgi:glycerate 2-kinase
MTNDEARHGPTAVACPDKFRGTLTAPEAAGAIAAGLRRGGFAEVRELPLADGGDGTLDTLVAVLGGSRRRARVTGPLGAPVDAEWAMLSDGTAIVEMARASGLSLVGRHNDPLRATTRGTGELVATAARSGAKRVLVCVGGSATTDGGLGAIDALGWALPVDVVVACDVATPFLEAARVYGPQKGASDAQVALLSRRLERLAQQYEARTRTDVTELEGGGAAGGLAGGLAALGARLEPGFDVVAAAVGLEEALDGTTLVVTGEGRLDLTSLEGKVVGGVLDWAADLGVEHCAVIAGQVADDARDELSLRHTQVLALTDRVWQPDEVMRRAALLLEEAAVEAARHALR